MRSAFVEAGFTDPWIAAARNLPRDQRFAKTRTNIGERENLKSFLQGREESCSPRARPMVHYGCTKTDSGGVECFVEFKESAKIIGSQMTERNSVDRATRFIEIIATVGSFLLVLVTLPFSLCFTFKVVQEYERAVVFRMGRLKGDASGPGTFFVMPCVDTCVRVDLRTVSFDVPPQEVLTKDSVTVTVDAVVYYRIKEPLNAVVKIANYSHSTRLLAASTLRTVLGTRNLAEILSERENISHTMQTSLDEATDPWGVKVERVEIKDVRLPVQLQRAMATEAEATREARAKVIAAEGEMLASRALKEASDVISTSPAALQLRYLQTLSNISAEKNSTIIFPLPVEFLTPFITSGAHSKIDQKILKTSFEERPPNAEIKGANR